MVKKITGTFLVLSFLFFGSFGFAFAETINGTITGDTGISSYEPNTNMGNGTEIWLQEGGTERAIFNFSIPAMPEYADTITSIKLYARVIDSPEPYKQVEVRELTQDFTEMGATWNTYDGSNNWISSGGDYSATIIDSIPMVNVGQWLVLNLYGEGSDNPISYTWGDNFDLILKANEAGGNNRISSTEGDYTPYLEITYTTTGEPEEVVFDLLSPSSTSGAITQLGGNITANIDSVWEVVLLALSIPLSFMITRKVINLF